MSETDSTNATAKFRREEARVEARSDVFRKELGLADLVLTQVQIRRVEARVARLWPPGQQALGLAAARVAESLVTSARRAVSVLTVLAGEFGVRNRVGVLPCLLGPHGIAEVRLPVLNARERIQLETALGA